MVKVGVKMNGAGNNNYSSENNMIIGGNIRNARISRGYTIEALAKQLDISLPYLGLIERGERCPSLHTLMKICKIFSLTPDDIILKDNKYRLLAKDSKESEILKIKDMLNQFEDKELILIVNVIKGLGKIKKSKK